MQIDEKNSIFDNILKSKKKMADIFFVKMTDILDLKLNIKF